MKKLLILLAITGIFAEAYNEVYLEKLGDTNTTCEFILRNNIVGDEEIGKELIAAKNAYSKNKTQANAKKASKLFGAMALIKEMTLEVLDINHCSDTVTTKKDITYKMYISEVQTKAYDFMSNTSCKHIQIGYDQAMEYPTDYKNFKELHKDMVEVGGMMHALQLMCDVTIDKEEEKYNTEMYLYTGENNDTI